MTGQEFFDATAFPFIWAEEGGYNPNDPSMHGVTQTSYDAWRRSVGMPVRDVRLIESAEAYAIYHDNYWTLGGAASIADSGNLPLSLVHFDAGVNQGLSAAQGMLTASSGNVDDYLAQREERYRALAASDPARHAADLSGWLQRLDDVRAAITGGTVAGISVGAMVILGVFLLARARPRSAHGRV